MMTGPDPTSQQITAHALLIGDRINTAGFEGEILSSTPLAVRVGRQGLAVVFRYGVVVFLGLTADDTKESGKLGFKKAPVEHECPALEDLGRRQGSAGGG